MSADEPATEKKSWAQRLFGGFRKTSDRLSENLAAITEAEAPAEVLNPEPAPPVAPTAPIAPTKKPPAPRKPSIIEKFSGATRLSDDQLDVLEDALILSDLGPRAAERIRNQLAAHSFERGINDAAIKAAVADAVTEILRPVAKPLEITAFPRPHVVLVIGVNGSGKTTTIAKLAQLFTEQDYAVMLAAGDTFRAAAIGQLKVWAERVGVPIVTGPEGGDPASIVFDAVQQATQVGSDVLIVDTAGRLHNKRELMDELSKIRRVLGRLNAAAPHDVVLVLDATNGQNALQQIDTFREMAGVTGLVMTKLDGTARGGVLVAAAEQYGLPIHAIGVGETLDDLRPFDADLVGKVIAGAA